MWSDLVLIVKSGVLHVMEIVKSIKHGKQSVIKSANELEQLEEPTMTGTHQNPQDGESPIEYNRCRRCGRVLKDPESRQVGYGKVCLEKIQRDQSNRLF